MVAPTVVKIRTGNLARFRLSPKQATYLLSVVGMTNLVIGLVIGIFIGLGLRVP